MTLLRQLLGVSTATIRNMFFYLRNMTKAKPVHLSRPHKIGLGVLVAKFSRSMDKIPYPYMVKSITKLRDGLIVTYYNPCSWEEASEKLVKAVKEAGGEIIIECGAASRPSVLPMTTSSTYPYTCLSQKWYFSVKTIRIGKPIIDRAFILNDIRVDPGDLRVTRPTGFMKTRYLLALLITALLDHMPLAKPPGLYREVLWHMYVKRFGGNVDEIMGKALRADKANRIYKLLSEDCAIGRLAFFDQEFLCYAQPRYAIVTVRNVDEDFAKLIWHSLTFAPGITEFIYSPSNNKLLFIAKMATEEFAFKVFVRTIEGELMYGTSYQENILPFHQYDPAVDDWIMDMNPLEGFRRGLTRLEHHNYTRIVTTSAGFGVPLAVLEEIGAPQYINSKRLKEGYKHS